MGFTAACLGFILVTAPLVHAADSLTWRGKENRVDAEIQSWDLEKLLQKITTATGWQVYVEPGTTHTSSVTFKNLQQGDALRSLLGNLNFALLPQTNGSPRLFVFSTSLQEATQLVRVPAKTTASGSAKPIPNELIVAMKPGSKMSIDDLARLLGAKVIGRIDGLHAYRLQFENEAAAQAARESLANNPDVAQVDYNYPIERPAPAEQVLASSSPPIQLKPRVPGDTGRLIVGLIDTQVQSLGGGLDAFLLPSIAVAGESQSNSGLPTHGTSMAETILRSLDGMLSGSSSVQILPVDVYGKNVMTTTFDVAYGIYQAVNAGANPINLSLGSGGDSTFLHNVIQSASQQGVLFFAAAGNSPVTTPTYPAAYPEVVAVTAGDRKGQIASYANRGSFVDIVAPGSSIVYFNGQAFYVSGTSAATAYATGMAAGRAEQTGQTLSKVEADMLKTLAVKPASSP
ncbi:MAG: S8 family serine peptidase [Verrucomicrobia bacterium]|nr:S8 family serine peptidase [Verrucomicrobiota bacterium]